MRQREAIINAIAGLSRKEQDALLITAKGRYPAERYAILYTYPDDNSAIEGVYGTLAGMAEGAIRFHTRCGDVGAERLAYLDLFDADAIPCIEEAINV